MAIQAQIEGRAALRQAGIWPAVELEAAGQAVPHVVAAARTGRALAAYGAGRVLQVTHRVHVAGAAGRAEGRAELDIDGWTGDVLRVRYLIVAGAERIEVQECSSFRDHDAAMLKISLRLARKGVTLAAGPRDLVFGVASGLERRCKKTLAAVCGALS